MLKHCEIIILSNFSLKINKMLPWIRLGLLVCMSFSLNAQKTALPLLLKGTWQIDNGNVFEHWDVMDENHMKGLSYKLVNGEMKVSEYLEISRVKKEIVYTATVLGQNQGKPVSFKLVHSDTAYVFENPDHDFPKQIMYVQTIDKQIAVKISDKVNKEFTMLLTTYPASKEKVVEASQNPVYDAELAQKLGADDYGMKGYTFVILKTGPNTSTDKEFLNKCFADHMANIKKLAAEKKLVVAGPLGKNGLTYRGIFIFNTTNPEEAKAWMEGDTAIKEGVFDVEMFSWYGSAALPEYLESAAKISKLKF